MAFLDNSSGYVVCQGPCIVCCSPGRHVEGVLTICSLQATRRLYVDGTPCAYIFGGGDQYIPARSLSQGAINMHGVAAVSVRASDCLGRREAWPAVQLPRTLHVRGRIEPREVGVVMGLQFYCSFVVYSVDIVHDHLCVVSLSRLRLLTRGAVQVWSYVEKLVQSVSKDVAVAILGSYGFR